MKQKTKKITFMGLLLGIGYVLPLLTSNIPTIGKVLSPMHIPVFLCGFLLGPIYGLILGIILPLTRSLIFLTPVFPLNLSMALELGTYGLVSGLLIKIIKTKNNILNLYISLIIAMILGRISWGIGRYIISLFTKEPFTISMFIKVGFLTAYPGIIIQLLIIPVLVNSLKKLKMFN